MIDPQSQEDDVRLTLEDHPQHRGRRQISELQLTGHKTGHDGPGGSFVGRLDRQAMLLEQPGSLRNEHWPRALTGRGVARLDGDQFRHSAIMALHV